MGVIYLIIHSCPDPAKSLILSYVEQSNPTFVRPLYIDAILAEHSLHEWGQAVYCSISFNSAGPVTRYRPAEILISALSEFGRDKARNSAVQCRRPQNYTMLRLWLPNGFGTRKNCPLPPLHFGNFEGRVTRYCRIEWNTTVCLSKSINNIRWNRGVSWLD